MIWFIVLLLLCIVVFIWLLPIHMEIRFHRQEGDDEGFIGVTTLLGLVRYKKRLTHLALKTSGLSPVLHVGHVPGNVNNASLSQDTKSSSTNEKLHTEHFSLSDLWQEWPKVRKWVQLGKRAKPVLWDLLRRTEIRRFKCHMMIGTGEVISTGMLCGTAWAGIFSVLGRLSYLCRFPDPPDVKVVGSFSRPSMHVNVDCMVSIRTGHAIVAGLRLIRLWRRRAPHGTSDSRADADRNDKHS